MSRAPVLIMAGGTGGHVFPALAVARVLRSRSEEIVWLGTRQGIEARIVPANGIALETLRVTGLRRKGLLTWLLAPWRIAVAVADAISVLRRRRPKVVLGMGGFAAGPGGVAAWLLGRPLIIHEQNAIAGLTNRLLARFAREVLEAFPGSFSRGGAGRKIRCTGNPVRRDIGALPAPAERHAGRTGPLRLLVLGGSLGAQVLNDTVPRAIALMPAARRPEILHQAGEKTVELARERYRETDVAVRVEPFIEDMASAYAWADVVVCRAGALTIAELAAAGLPAILVPFPGAVDDHQTRNAEHFVATGAGVLMPQQTLTPERLAAELDLLAADRSLALRRAEQARALARPAATEDIADLCQLLGDAA
ncbi:MAG: undecaprenyldiphospho-muramoylpentapeptide beta-N-acetylglucosaminyltransferase [Gammaproteobacteria bacterium]|nr:undecaprenyldiphospho-muramoylpentapeptide beta-N-acetylglucosaminyltransferase [Gammaproteobacteria bacterium]